MSHSCGNTGIENAIDSADRIDCINHINPIVLNCSALQLKDDENDPKNMG